MRVERVFQPPPTVQLNQLLSATVRTGRISLPVNGPFGYTRLKHIQGVPSEGGAGGFSVQRLQVIDSLIDRLTRVGGTRIATKDYGEVARQLHAAIQAAESGGHAAGMGLSDVGTIVSMLV